LQPPAPPPDRPTGRLHQRGAALVTLAGLGMLGLGGALVHGVGTAVADHDPVGHWNALAVRAGATLERGTSQQRALAMVHLAIHDALNAIRPVYAPYALVRHAHANASPDAAIATAAHDVLVETVPAQRIALDAEYADALDDIPDGTPKQEGIDVGHDAARTLVALRKDDGAERADIAYIGKPGLGAWEPTPPHHLRALLPGWASVAPFALASAGQFLPPAPPALRSAQYARDYEEVRRIGADNSSVRTPEQGAIAHFWSANVGETWNDIARQIVAARAHDGDPRNDLDAWDRARLFALLNMAMADGFVSGWNAKYHYRFWRPVTAIHRGHLDGNPATVPDATWSSFLATPEHPEYPSAHSVLSGAAVGVLACVLGSDRVPLVVTRGSAGDAMTRRYRGFHAMAREIAESRVYAGVHFRSANENGLGEGRRIGQWVCGGFLPPLARQPAVAPRRPEAATIGPGGVGQAAATCASTPRKVRAPQGTVPGNAWAARADGKCNREQTADGRAFFGMPWHRQG